MPLVIEMPPREEQLAFNKRRWAEVLEDPEIANLSGKIETNRHGQVLMMPPASGSHSHLQGEIAFRLRQVLGGKTLPECPISTADGVRAADVGWYSEARFAEVEGQLAFEKAPEICVEVMSPCNTPQEMTEKALLYFEAGAEEVWICDLKGQLRFFQKEQPQTAAPQSKRCPEFPEAI